jgi:filamentous hemagglutinin
VGILNKVPGLGADVNDVGGKIISSIIGKVSSKAPELGALENSVFAQVPAKSTKAFSETGQQIYSQAAGSPIQTVNDLTQALIDGTINPSDVPLDYVVIDGQNVIANTRSSTALINAGIPKNEWYGINQTGVTAYGDVTYNDLVQNQLNKNYGGSVNNARK